MGRPSMPRLVTPSVVDARKRMTRVGTRQQHARCWGTGDTAMRGDGGTHTDVASSTGTKTARTRQTRAPSACASPGATPSSAHEREQSRCRARLAACASRPATRRQRAAAPWCSRAECSSLKHTPAAGEPHEERVAQQRAAERARRVEEEVVVRRQRSSRRRGVPLPLGPGAPGPHRTGTRVLTCPKEVVVVPGPRAPVVHNSCWSASPAGPGAERASSSGAIRIFWRRVLLKRWYCCQQHTPL